jgi:hypothetical protein
MTCAPCPCRCARRTWSGCSRAGRTAITAPSARATLSTSSWKTLSSPDSWSGATPSPLPTATLQRQSRSNQVSSRGLPKTGIFAKTAGDIRELGQSRSPIWEGGDRRQVQETPLLTALSRLPKETGSEAGLRGWGGRDRTSEWRNQNQLDYSTISGSIWKKGRKCLLAISIAWHLFPNK